MVRVSWYSGENLSFHLTGDLTIYSARQAKLELFYLPTCVKSLLNKFVGLIDKIHIFVTGWLKGRKGKCQQQRLRQKNRS